MPIHTTIEAESRLLISTFSGAVSDEDFLRARRQLLVDPLFDLTFDRLWDFCQVTKVDVSEYVARSRDFNRQIAVFPSREEARAWIEGERAAETD